MLVLDNYLGRAGRQKGVRRMPRIDRGSLIVDSSVILASSRDVVNQLSGLALEEGAFLVTSPSIIPVWSPGLPLRVSLGIGSLIFQPDSKKELESLGIRFLESSSPEWVDACRLGPGSEGELRREEGGVLKRGRVIPASRDDPIILFLAGVEAEYYSDGCSGIPAAYADETPVICYERDENVTTSIVGGEALFRLEYILPLARSCIGR